MGKEAPHVGFPEAVISKYAQKLVAIGYKVGVVEQMETPQELKARNDAKPKGVKKESAVRRELCQVLTKGTAANADVDATYLLAVTEDVEAGSIGVCYVDAQVTATTSPPCHARHHQAKCILTPHVCYVDAQTAAFSFGECVDDEHHSCLRTLLAQLRPAEVVIDATKISREAHALLRRAVPPNQLSALPAAAWWAPAAARREVGGYFDGGAAGGGGNQKWPEALAAAAEEGGKETKPLGLAAVGGCVSYLRRLLLDRQTVPLGNFTTWTPSDGVEATAAARSLVLDSKAIENLELFANSSDHGADGTLFKVLDKTASPFGKRLLRRWVCAPLRAVDEITERQVTRRRPSHRHTLHHHRHLHLTIPPPCVRTRWAR